MAYFIISKFDLSDFLRFWDNRVFLKIAERGGASRKLNSSSVNRIRVRRARARTIVRATASITDTETLSGIGIRNKTVGKTNGRRTSYLRGHTAQTLVALTRYES